MGQDIPAFAVNIQYVFIGLSLALVVPHLVATFRGPRDRLALWSASSGLSLACTLAANIWLFNAAHNELGAAMFTRDAMLVLVVLVQVPAVASFAGRPPPTGGLVVLALLGAGRLVLWQTTDLIYAHRTAAGSIPRYGPLLGPFSITELALSLALIVYASRGWKDRMEKSVFMAGLALGMAAIATSLILTGTATAELLTGYWVIPWVVALQVLFVRRVLGERAAAERLAVERSTALAGLAHSEQRSRLALQSGAMGWFEYDTTNRRLMTSPELRTLLGLNAEPLDLTIDAALGFFHPEDRQSVRTSIAHAEAHGSGTAQGRWLRPDGTMLWVETSALCVQPGQGPNEVIGVARDVTDQKHAEEELVAHAHQDGLTNLPNRASLTMTLRQALSLGRPFSLFLVDLDGFADINYSLGHRVGDDVLAGVARRLGAWLPNGDVLARSDGDEFAIVIYQPPERAEATAEEILHLLEEPVRVGPLSITVRGRVGMACAPQDSSDADTLLRRAASAMYTARRRRGRAHRYHQGDDQGPARRFELAGRLPLALASGEVEVHYQPTVELEDGRCEVLEALVRWQHPDLGTVPPLEFVPLAEQYGHGLDLFRSVLAQSLACCSGWRDAGLARAVAVNASPLCLLSTGFITSISTALAGAGLTGEALVIELTEDAFAFDAPGAYDVLCQLRELGALTAIDDFGTGYSSLSYLRQLPIDVIKLDRSFVTGLDGRRGHDPVVAHTVELGHELGLKVVAEGVETLQELEAVRYYNCDVAQGYWFCRPSPASAATTWLEGRVSAAKVKGLPGPRAGHN